MAIFSTRTRRIPTSPAAPRRLLAGVLAGLMLLFLPGCGGCRKQPDLADIDVRKKLEEEAEKAKKKEKEKPPLEAKQEILLPDVPTLNSSHQCKPGHWVSFQMTEVKANKEDYPGSLESTVIDRQLKPVHLPATPYDLTSFRPAVLPKEQAKTLESYALIPSGTGASALSFKLTNARGGGPELDHAVVLAKMPSYRYHFVVLSRTPGRYSYLGKDLDAISLRPAKGSLGSDKRPHYQIVEMPASGRPRLPSRGLFWTSIAYVLWDDFDPALLDLDQQQAMLDWLHWGGQIILSGPDTLDTLRSSFLGPYLPAAANGTRMLARDDLAPLDYWSRVPEKPLKARQPWTGVQMEKHRDAETIRHTGGLVLERGIGRGRIVISAFRLGGVELTTWPGFDCFFNACLLRRPPRQFLEDHEAALHMIWAGAAEKTPALDARQNTRLRYFARDEGVPFVQYAHDVVAEEREEKRNSAAATSSYYYNRNSNADQQDDANATYDFPAPGVGAWNDYSPAAETARRALADASGISVPERSFIIQVLVFYLAVLVPGNWLVFRSIRRVEWAWIAAPLIAIGGTLLVIHLAQLNVGFARSQNEIAVVELQGNYPRAHVTRYTSLYTSLATQYEFRFPDPGSLSVPFPQGRPEAFRMQRWQDYVKLECRRDEDMRLTGFSVPSNAIDFLHSEEMLDLGGPLALVETDDMHYQVTNRTHCTLKEVQVIRKNLAGDLEFARPGSFKPGETVVLEFAAGKLAAERDAGATGSARASPAAGDGRSPSGQLRVQGMYDLASKAENVEAGETRLVAVISDGIAKLDVKPSARQSPQAVLLVAHLEMKPGAPPQPDANARRDVEGDTSPYVP